MYEFVGTDQQFAMLRQALIAISRDGGITSKAILRASGVTGYHYTSLNRFINGHTRAISRDVAGRVWSYVSSDHPHHIFPKYEDREDRFFYSLCEFFEVNLHEQNKLSSSLAGEYELFHVSQLFDNEMNVLIASVSITACPNGSSILYVKERQEYDGRLGGCSEIDEFRGYVFERSGDVYFITKGMPQHTPKIYIFDRRHDNPETGETDWIEGVMTKGAGSNRAAFHSPAYARRSSAVEPRIVTIEEMKDMDIRIARKLVRAIK